jgi:hypothetical protein
MGPRRGPTKSICIWGKTMSAIVKDDRIVLRQSWLNDLAMCPERARQNMLGLSKSTESTNTMIGNAVHSGIEYCLQSVIDNGTPETLPDTIEAGRKHWQDRRAEIVRWNHKEDKANQIIENNLTVWWNQVRPELRPLAVEYSFELPLVPDQSPQIWLKGTIDLIQESPLPITDWKNPGRKPNDAWEKKRWAVQAAAYTWAVASLTDEGLGEALLFEFVQMVNGEVYRTVVDYGPAEWASLVALARSAGTLIAADLPVWPLQMTGWHCSPKWCGAWSTCRGRHAGPDPWNQL